jgi:choline-sulfatase
VRRRPLSLLNLLLSDHHRPAILHHNRHRRWSPRNLRGRRRLPLATHALSQRPDIRRTRACADRPLLQPLALFQSPHQTHRMNILYIDIDSLRPDHLGCYGYDRPTSPNIDAIAARGVRMQSCHAPDAPCLPSRTALMSGRCGWSTGVVNHGGLASQPRPDGPTRGFRDSFRNTSWAAALREAGYYTASISPFGERHSAWHWYAGFNEIINPGGKGGNEVATEVMPAVENWLRRESARGRFFLHFNLWDPHTPYRTPAEYGNPFAEAPLPAWLTEDVRVEHWRGCGPHSAQELNGFDIKPWFNPADYPRQPLQAASMADVRAMFDGYDTGVRYADDAVGRVLNLLADLNLLDTTAIMLSADYGENLGELNIYGDHQTADEITTRVPLILHWPGVTDSSAGHVLGGLHYAYDAAASTIELAGGTVPDNWDGKSFARDLRAARNPVGRDHLVVSQGAWTCQRGVRWEHFLYVHTRHDGFHAFPDEMVFDLATDPHEQHNLAFSRHDLLLAGRTHHDAWLANHRATGAPDPFDTVMAEGGPSHCRGQLAAYLDRLRHTDRAALAAVLASRHPR